MATNAEVEFYKSLFYSPSESIIDTLDMLMLIDIGIIQDIDANGRASVMTSKVSNGVPYILNDIEVLGLGNRNGAFIANACGGSCLLFAPRTNVPDVRDMNIDITTTPFSNANIKALPVSNGRGMYVNAYFNAEGTLTIATDNYQLSFAERKVSYNAKGMCINITPNNKIYLYRRNENSGVFEITMDDSGFITEFINMDKDSKYTLSLLDDGTFTIHHVQPGASGSEDTELNTIAIAKDGALSVSVTDKVTVTIDKDGVISLSTEGNVSIESTKGTLSLVSDGDMSLTSNNGKVSVQSKDELSVKSTNGNIKIDSATAGSSVQVNGTNLKVDK